MLLTLTRDLPFTEAVIGNIKCKSGYVIFTVLSGEHKGKRFKIRIPANDEWIEADPCNIDEPIKVRVELKEHERLGKTHLHGRLKPIKGE